jgi:pyruvate dehydrogenase E1 component
VAVHLLGSGAILGEVRAAAALLADEWGVASDVWSVTSYSELAREAWECERWNRLHPAEAPRTSLVGGRLAGGAPVVAASDYVRAYPQLIAPSVERLAVLGTDGFGRSDTRMALRRFFEVDRAQVVVAALGELVRTGALEAGAVADAIRRYDLDADSPAPWTR